MPRRWASVAALMSKPVRKMIEGKPVLLVLDGQQSGLVRIPLLIEAARECQMPLVFASNVITAVDDQITPRSNEYWIRPRRCSVFFGTELSILLQDLGVRTLVLAGGQTSVSVHYSFVDGHQHDYFCRVVEDCMAGSSPAAHEAALQAMEYMQTGARQKSEAVMAEFRAFRDAAKSR